MPLKSAVDLDLLGIIFFALMFGAALTQIPAERARPMIGFLEALNDVVIKIVGFAMRLAPYGVAGLIFGVTSAFGFHLLKPLAAYVIVVLGALLFHVLINLTAILRFLARISPMLFFKRTWNAIVTAFSTSSSSGISRSTRIGHRWRSAPTSSSAAAGRTSSRSSGARRAIR